MSQDAVIPRQLQIKQGLIELLSLRPAKGWNWHQRLAFHSVGRQTAARTAPMDDQFAALPQPGGKVRAVRRVAPGAMQKVRCPSTRPELAPWWIAARKPIGPLSTGQRLERCRHVRRQRDQVLKARNSSSDHDRCMMRILASPVQPSAAPGQTQQPAAGRRSHLWCTLR